MGLRDKFRRSRSFGPVEPDALVAPEFAGSSTSFHTALDFLASTDALTLASPVQDRSSAILDARPRPRSQLNLLDTDLQLGREYQSSPLLGPSGAAVGHAAPADPLRPTSTQGVDDIVALLRELKKTASPEHLAAIRNALALDGDDHGLDASQDASDIAQSPVAAAAAAAAAANTSLHHRKSLFRPGVATRNSTANVLRKRHASTKHDSTAPALQSPNSWSQDMFITSPLGQIAGLKDEGLSISLARAATPSEADYQHLGAFKLGSLRITNGAASPEPSIYSSPPQLRRPHANLERMRDYFDASEGSGSHCTDGRSTTDGESMPPTPGDAGCHDAPLLSAVARPMQLGPAPANLRPPSPVRRDRPRSAVSPSGPREAPLRHVASRESCLSTSPQRQQLGDGPTACSHSPSPDYPHLAAQPPEQLYAFYEASDPAQTAANVESPEAHPRLAEGNHRQLQKLNGSSLVRSERSMVLSDASSFYPDLAEADVQRAPSFRRPPIDSGYHSESSLRLSPEKPVQSLVVEQPTNPINSPNVLQRHVWDESSRADQMAVLTNHDRREQHQPRTGTTDLEESSPRPMQPSRSPSITPQPSRLLESTSTPVTPSKSADAATPKSNKLKKKDRRKSFVRTHSSPVIVQSAQNFVDLNSVPAVPAEVASKYTKRMSMNPSMENLEHTFSSVSAVVPRPESSAASTAPEPIEIRFPSPTAGIEAEPTQSRGRRAVARGDGPEAPPPPRHRLLRSLSRKRRSGSRPRNDSPTLDDEDMAGLELADFGTVAASLGASPYEQATPVGSRSSRVDSSRIQHPHQISYRPSPGKNLVGMSEEQASRMAMLRSRDRLSNPGPQEPTLPVLKPVESRVRDVESNGEYQRPRAKSRSDKVPPVPALPDRSNTRRPKSMHETATRSDGAFDQPVQSVGPAKSKTWGVDDTSNWDGTARLWRQRRKSIGEGLLHKAFQEGGDATAAQRRDGAEPAKHRRPEPASGRPQTELFLPTHPTFHPNAQQSAVHPLSSARTTSPTQAIRNRAAMFERGFHSSSPAPMPPRESADLYQRQAPVAELQGGAQMSMLSMSMQLRRWDD